MTTPNMYNMDLWEQSGHAAHYKDAMFRFPVEGQEFGAYCTVARPVPLCALLRVLCFVMAAGEGGCSG